MIWSAPMPPDLLDNRVCRPDFDSTIIEILEAIRHLPVRERLSVLARYGIEGEPKDIAEQLGCSLQTVYSLARRAVSRLRIKFGDK